MSSIPTSTNLSIPFSVNNSLPEITASLYQGIGEAFASGKSGDDLGQEITDIFNKCAEVMETKQNEFNANEQYVSMLEKAQNKNVILIKSFEETNKSLLEKINKLESDSVLLKKDNDNLNKDFSISDTFNKKLSEDSIKLHDLFQNLQKSYQELMGSQKDLIEQQMNLASKTVTIETGINKISENNASLTRQQADLLDVSDSLYQKFLASKTKIDELEKNTTMLINQMQDLKKDYSNLQNLIEKIIDSTKRLQEQNEEQLRRSKRFYDTLDYVTGFFSSYYEDVKDAPINQQVVIFCRVMNGFYTSIVSYWKEKES